MWESIILNLSFQFTESGTGRVLAPVNSNPNQTTRIRTEKIDYEPEKAHKKTVKPDRKRPRPVLKKPDQSKTGPKKDRTKKRPFRDHSRPVQKKTEPLRNRSLKDQTVQDRPETGPRPKMCTSSKGQSPIGLRNEGFTMGQTVLKAASCKVMKHEKACIENQHVFIPFVFDTFGFLAPEAVDLLNRVQRVMHSNVMTPKSMDVVFKRVGFAIQKWLAAQLVTRLPSTSM
ncbi:hypothetical protein LXL04_028325 [Taraxacum kok-saghyz]